MDDQGEEAPRMVCMEFKRRKRGTKLPETEEMLEEKLTSHVGHQNVRIWPVTWAVKEFPTKRKDAQNKFILLSQRGKSQCIANQYRAINKGLPSLWRIAVAR